MSEESAVPAKSERGHRSPGYPSIPLEVALKRAEDLRAYSPANRPIPVPIALKQWNYGPNSGAGLQQIATLLKFGLLEDKGSKDQRVVVLTDRARRILLDELNSPERKKLIREAALLPVLHADIRAHWPHGLPDDGKIRSWLLLQKHFNENAVDAVIGEIRATFEFAQLDAEPESVILTVISRRVTSLRSATGFSGNHRGFFNLISPSRSQRSKNTWAKTTCSSIARMERSL
jgi:hypothetical protein